MRDVTFERGDSICTMKIKTIIKKTYNSLFSKFHQKKAIFSQMQKESILHRIDDQNKK